MLKPQEILDFIQDKIDDNCTLRLVNLQAQVRDEFGVEVSKSTIDRGIDSFRYFVKRIQNIAIAADTPENEVKRIEFALWYIQMTLEGRTMINVDENDLMNRINDFQLDENDFQLDEEKALAYFAHIRNNCMA